MGQNAEQMNTAFLQYTLLGWLETWQAAYKRTLIVPADRDTISIEFIVDDFLRADTATRADSYQKLRASGVVTANEIRALENLPALPDGNSLASPFTSTGAKPVTEEINQ